MLLCERFSFPNDSEECQRCEYPLRELCLIASEKLKGQEVKLQKEVIEQEKVVEQEKAIEQEKVVEQEKRKRVGVRQEVIDRIDIERLVQEKKTKTNIVRELLGAGLNYREIVLILKKIYSDEDEDRLYHFARAVKSSDKREKLKEKKEKKEKRRKKKKVKVNVEEVMEKIREIILSQEIPVVSQIVEEVKREYGGLENGEIFELIEKVYEKLEQELQHD